MVYLALFENECLVEILCLISKNHATALFPTVEWELS